MFFVVIVALSPSLTIEVIVIVVLVVAGVAGDDVVAMVVGATSRSTP